MSRHVWTARRVRQALGIEGTGAGADREFTGVSTDSRSIEPGELFVALRGERFDGTDFVSGAREAGARGAVVERLPEGLPEDFELFVVEDTLEALGRLAEARRRALDPTVVAITGTSGKTTTRELVAAALGPQSFASPRNFNNLVGVPLSMLRASEEARVWVLELASNQPGEIGRLGQIVEADVGAITSVGPGHLEGLGDLEGVLEEKVALLTTLGDEAQAVVADDPPELARRAREACRNVVTVGLGEGADAHPESWSVTRRGAEWRWRGVGFRVSGWGSHMVRNGMVAAVVAEQLGVEPGEAAERMERVEPLPMREEVREIGDLTLLVDCYNANPSSFEAALEALDTLGEGRRRAALVGTMLELGDASAALHRVVAERLGVAGIDVLAATGEFAAPAARLGGAAKGTVISEQDPEGAYDRLVSRLRGDEIILLKASRGVHLERLIPLFERDFGRAIAKNSSTEA